MPILIVECIEERFRHHFREHDCQKDVFVTVDKDSEYQQDLRDRKIAILIFRAKSNGLKD